MLVERDSDTISLSASLPEILSLEICDPTSEIDPDTEPDTDKDAASCSAPFSLTAFSFPVSSTVMIFCSLLKNLGARLTNAFWFAVLPSTAEVAADASLSKLLVSDLAWDKDSVVDSETDWDSIICSSEWITPCSFSAA